MLAALRRAGSALPKHARRRLRELQSRRRCLPAEPGADSRPSWARCAGRACAAPPRSNRWSERCRHDSRPIPGRDSRSLDEADTVSAADVGELRHLLPAAKLTARRRSVKVRPVLASPHHPRCPLSLWRSAAGPPASTLIGSQRRLIWAPLRPQPASVASSSHRLSVRTDSGDHTHHCTLAGDNTEPPL